MSWDLIIIPIVQVLLAKCFQQINPQQTPQQYLRSKYDSDTHTFDSKVLRDATRQVRRAALKAKKQASKAERKTFPKYSQLDYQNMAYEQLVKAMKAEPHVIASVMSIARAFPDMVEGDE